MATWNISFIQTPKSSDSPTQGDDSIRALAGGIEERMKNEHTTYSGDSTGGAKEKDWLHKPGSAVTFIQASAPTVRPTNAEALIDGILWFDTTSGVLKIRQSAAWTIISTQVRHVMIQGTLATGTNLLPAILFPKGCTIVKVSARVKTAPTGAAITIDLNQYTEAGVIVGAGSIWDGIGDLSISAGSYAAQSTTFHATNKILGDDHYLTFDITGVGGTIAGANLAVSILAT